jgi:cell division septal protein FtsQ
MKKEKAKLPAKLIASVIVILLALGFVAGYIWMFLSTSDYFTIKGIIVKDLNPDDFSFLLGKNIFSVDLKRESRHIMQFYPDSSRINLIRVLPDRLFINSVKRKPIAIVKLNRYFALDVSGTFFYTQAKPEEQQLPLVLGLETKISSPLPGRRYNLRELSFVINLIKEIKKSRELKDYIIKKIDVTSPNNTSILIVYFLEEAAPQETKGAVAPLVLEVKIGQDNVKQKIAILSGVIAQTRNDLARIKYIELRFKDTVIKFSDVKTK